ncbi:hypothetical protein K0040_15415 [Terrisporobacter petrolearius]|uniref:hypothetical protein n=1 Tax=Terrisporobacter petrolearius TaxID=1460447 RepID=UPI001D16D7BE|nr:hypothetical protein [Terrisporobacter petrolearius]MCC3865651.1 hypothetical protein [Terrisporobacter petrolearius]
MGILDFLKNRGDVVYTDERDRKVTLGDLAGTGYKYTILSDKFTQHAFNQGKHVGKKEGYQQASYEYEKKLLKQAEEFLKQTKIFESDKARYDKLIDDYERYIDEMMKKISMSNEEKDYMNQIMIMEKKLKKLK